MHVVAAARGAARGAGRDVHGRDDDALAGAGARLARARAVESKTMLPPGQD